VKHGQLTIVVSECDDLGVQRFAMAGDRLAEDHRERRSLKLLTMRFEPTLVFVVAAYSRCCRGSALSLRRGVASKGCRERERPPLSE
jgi:hypothetical protein